MDFPYHPRALLTDTRPEETAAQANQDASAAGRRRSPRTARDTKPSTDEICARQDRGARTGESTQVRRTKNMRRHHPRRSLDAARSTMRSTVRKRLVVNVNDPRWYRASPCPSTASDRTHLSRPRTGPHS